MFVILAEKLFLNTVSPTVLIKLNLNRAQRAKVPPLGNYTNV